MTCCDDKKQEPYLTVSLIGLLVEKRPETPRLSTPPDTEACRALPTLSSASRTIWYWLACEEGETRTLKGWHTLMLLNGCTSFVTEAAEAIRAAAARAAIARIHTRPFMLLSRLLLVLL